MLTAINAYRSTSRAWKNLALLALLCGCLVPLVGCATGGAAAGLPVVAGHEHGMKIYSRRCAECHGLYAPQRFSDQDWEDILPEMAREAQLSSKDEAPLLAYLQAANDVRDS